MQCPNCQNEVRPGQPFCDNCGRDLSDLQPAVTGNTSDQTNTPGSADANLPPLPDPPVDADAGAAASTPPVPPVATQAQLVIGEGSATYDLPAGREILVGRLDPIDGIYPDIDLTPHDPAVGVSRRQAIRPGAK